MGTISSPVEKYPERIELRMSTRAKFLPLLKVGAARPLLPHLRLSGVITSERRRPFQEGLSAGRLAPIIERAFSYKRAEAVLISVNSPGGAPVQSAMIARHIREEADRRKRKVIVFCEDIAASGGYWLALAGDEIYADAASIIGSIGVVYSGFGFSDLIQKWGIERRLYTAGDRKAMLDPFTPLRPEDVERLQGMQKKIHTLFIEQVRNRRKERLRASENELFNGNVWTGSEAVELGLIDGVADMRSLVRQRYGDKAKILPINRPRGFFSQLFGRSQVKNRFPGADFLPHLLQEWDDDTLWRRYGV